MFYLFNGKIGNILLWNFASRFFTICRKCTESFEYVELPIEKIEREKKLHNQKFSYADFDYILLLFFLNEKKRFQGTTCHCVVKCLQLYIASIHTLFFLKLQLDGC